MHLILLWPGGESKDARRKSGGRERARERASERERERARAREREREKAMHCRCFTYMDEPVAESGAILGQSKVEFRPFSVCSLLTTSWYALSRGIGLLSHVNHSPKSPR